MSRFQGKGRGLNGPVVPLDHVGQKFFDEAVRVVVSKARALDLSIAALFKRAGREATAIHLAPAITEISHYNRVPLRWMKPDGKGGLVPR